MNWKTPVTLLVLVAVLLGAAYYGWQTVTSPSSAGDEQTRSSKHHPCKKTVLFKRGERIAAGTVRVNVYNAGSISGLAGSTLEQLQAKGFRAGVAENAPASMAASNVTIVAPDRRAPQVALVARQFRGAVRHENDNLARGIDILVGDAFQGLDPTARPALRLKHPRTTCSPRGTSTG